MYLLVAYVKFLLRPPGRLYDPLHGYYTTKSKVFGSEGDFYTSPYTHPLFAEVLGDALGSYLATLGGESELHLVELGSGEGILGGGVLSRLENHHPEIFARLAYLPLEVGHSKLPQQFRGVVFSNEFFDALPVHRVRVRGGELREVYVRFEPGVEEVEGELSDPRILEYMRSGFAEWNEGYDYEVNLSMVETLEDLDRHLESGFLVTIDYGHRWEDYAAVERSGGTLMCYHRHRAHPDPYINIGQQDITAHVNFEVLERTGERLGWHGSDLKSQRQFLGEWGLEARLMEKENHEALKAAQLEELLGLKRLLLPGGVSDVMKVLVQSVRTDSARPGF